MVKSFFKRVILACGFLLLSFSVFADTVITNLQTEFMNSPMGIDVSCPRFSWQMQSDRYGASQTSYRILVSTSLDNLKNGTYLFDSGKVISSSSVGVSYEGDALRPTTRYYWKVIVSDEKGKSIESDPSWFETGLLGQGWNNAQWIGSPSYILSKYRSLFDIDYDFQLAKGSKMATFVFGAKSKTNYITLSLDLSKKTSTMILSHFLNGSTSVDAMENVSAIIPQSSINAIHHVKIEVTGAENYDMYISIDGQRIKYSGQSSDPYRFTVKNAIPEETNPNARLYQLGYNQPKGENVTFSNIAVSDRSWSTTLYKDTETHLVKGDNTLTLWQPGADVSAPMLRKTINIAKPIKQARLYATARGIYEFYINGKKVGADFYNPGWTDYRYRIMYNTYDITSMLKEGSNGLGAIVGTGWFSDVLGWTSSNWQNQWGIKQSVLAMVKVEYQDGSEGVYVTDGTWKCYDKGPIEANSLYNGEDYNAQKEVAGWSDGNFDDTSWKQASVVSGSKVILQGYVGQAIQNNITLTAQSVKKVGNVYIYDFGQNMVGVPRLSNLHGNAGQQLTIHYAEMLYPDVIPETPVPPYTTDMYKAKKGQMYLDNYRSALSTDHYIMKGDANGETFEPHFTSHGYRYLSIEGLDNPLPLESVKGIVVESIGKQTSSYETSNKDINKLFNNIAWGQRGNFLAVPTDCPQRDERLGWTGDAEIFCRAATYNMNVDQFYTRWLNTIRDDQAANGDYGGFYPDLGTPPMGATSQAQGRSGGWSEVGIVVPWQVYQQYADVRVLEEHYASMSRYIDFLERNATDYIQPGGGYGDWVAPVGTNTPLINTCYSAYAAQLMQQIALALGKTSDAKRYEAFYNHIKAAFNKTFVDADGYTVAPEDGKTVKVNTQTSYILPLQFGLFNDNMKETAIKHFVETVNASGVKLTTGFLGTPYICLVLSNNGYSDLAYKLFLQTEYPSWLFPVKQGASTMWERWNSYTVKDGFGPVGMNSFNHYAYGAIEEWIMSHSLGIQRDEKVIGYKHIILQPEVGEELDYAKGGFESMYGQISSSWEKNDKGYTYKVTIPANTTASLSLVAGGLKNVKVAKGAEGVTMPKYANGKVHYELKSGSYEFAIVK